MSTPSPKMGLALPALTDRFLTSEIRGNWEKIDGAPGTFICTSTTRPTGWGAAMAGRKIIETNTGLEYQWTGSTWQRSSGSAGILKTSGGQPAVAQRTTDFSTTSDTYVRVVTLNSVVVPSGNRALMIVANWYQSDNEQGVTYGAVFRSATNNSGQQLSKTIIASNPNGRGAGGTHITFEKTGLNAGTYDFSFQIRRGPQGGTSWMYGDATQPVQLTVIEL